MEINTFSSFYPFLVSHCSRSTLFLFLQCTGSFFRITDYKIFQISKAYWCNILAAYFNRENTAGTVEIPAYPSQIMPHPPAVVTLVWNLYSSYLSNSLYLHQIIFLYFNMYSIALHVMVLFYIVFYSLPFSFNLLFHFLHFIWDISSSVT